MVARETGSSRRVNLALVSLRALSNNPVATGIGYPKRTRHFRSYPGIMVLGGGRHYSPSCVTRRYGFMRRVKGLGTESG